jgi:uncharacterized protein YciI
MGALCIQRLLTEQKGEERMRPGRIAILLMLLLAVGRFLGAEEKKETAKPEEGKMTTVYLVLLKKGPAWRPGETPELKALMEAHLANIRALWQAKKMIVAGPLGDDGDLRGVFIFQAASLEEAKALAASDPAIKAGRLIPEIHPWWVEKAALPEAGSYCRDQAP